MKNQILCFLFVVFAVSSLISCGPSKPDNSYDEVGAIKHIIIRSDGTAENSIKKLTPAEIEKVKTLFSKETGYPNALLVKIADSVIAVAINEIAVYDLNIGDSVVLHYYPNSGTAYFNGWPDGPNGITKMPPRH